jgi:hypothetical protein
MEWWYTLSTQENRRRRRRIQWDASHRVDESSFLLFDEWSVVN